MGFWKEMFSNMDEPALILQFSKDDSDKRRLIDENRRLKETIVSQKVNEVIEENKKLKKQLAMRRINAIEIDGKKMLENEIE